MVRKRPLHFSHAVWENEWSDNRLTSAKGSVLANATEIFSGQWGCSSKGGEAESTPLQRAQSYLLNINQWVPNWPLQTVSHTVCFCFWARVVCWQACAFARSSPELGQSQQPILGKEYCPMRLLKPQLLTPLPPFRITGVSLKEHFCRGAHSILSVGRVP